MQGWMLTSLSLLLEVPLRQGHQLSATPNARRAKDEFEALPSIQSRCRRAFYWQLVIVACFESRRHFVGHRALTCMRKYNTTQPVPPDSR